ncbi:teichoic acid transport system permease protein [Zhihengliuella halotolerans]|uniref:Transport permease protein n=1 Tax=Zhihengliuella halotolerans TaxID=370736 RepID=A0A4Q8ABW6_9MICC|nr:teichoic acid transport system permease protein [Zhihengliuella halotolerans]
MTDQSSPGAARPDPLRLETGFSGLARVGARPSLPAYIASLWAYRHFIRFDALSRLKSNYRKNVLGPVWLVLTPVLNGLTYYLIFGLLLNLSRGIDNYVGYLLIGVFGFQFTNKVVMAGGSAINNNRKVVEAFSFPRASLPIAASLRETLGYIPGYLAMLVLILAIATPDEITWRWLYVVPIVALQAIFSQGIGLLLSRVIAAAPDFLNIMSFTMRIWMYASGVFYSFDRFANRPELAGLLDVLEGNPLYQILSMLRGVLLYAESPSLEQWLLVGAWAAGAYAVGFIVFWSAEETYSREAK